MDAEVRLPSRSNAQLPSATGPAPPIVSGETPSGRPVIAHGNAPAVQVVVPYWYSWVEPKMALPPTVVPVPAATPSPRPIASRSMITLTNAGSPTSYGAWDNATVVSVTLPTPSSSRTT